MAPVWKIILATVILGVCATGCAATSPARSEQATAKNGHVARHSATVTNRRRCDAMDNWTPLLASSGISVTVYDGGPTLAIANGAAGQRSAYKNIQPLDLPYSIELHGFSAGGVKKVRVVQHGRACVIAKG